MDYASIEAKRDRLGKMRPLTPGEVKRLREEFMVEFTYNSNPKSWIIYTKKTAFLS